MLECYFSTFSVLLFRKFAKFSFITMMVLFLLENQIAAPKKGK